MALQNIEANITLDLYNHDTTPSTVKAIQLDSQTRYVAAMLQNGGVQYDVDSGATVQLIVVRPDKVGVQITGETFTYGDEGAQFLGPYAELTQVALAVNGKMRGQFKITSGTQILRTEIFAISNGEALDASTDEWADEYDGYNLEEMAADISQIKEDFNDLNEFTVEHTTPSENLWSAVWEFGSLKYADGTNEPSSTLIRTKDFIEVEPSFDYAFYDGRDWAKAEYDVAYPVQYVFEYDVNRAFVRFTTIYVQKFTTSATTRYVRFLSATVPTTFDVTVFNTKSFTIVKGSSYRGYVSPVSTNIVKCAFNGHTSDNLFDGNFYRPYIAKSSGAVNVNSSTLMFSTGFIKVSASEYPFLYSNAIGMTNNTAGLSSIICYDANKQYIGSGNAQIIDVSIGSVKKYTLLTNTEYVVLTTSEYGNSTANQQKINESIEFYESTFIITTNLDAIYANRLIDGSNKINPSDANNGFLEGVRHGYIRDFMLAGLDEYSDALLASSYDAVIPVMADIHRRWLEPYAVLNYMALSGCADMVVNLGDSIPDHYDAKADAVNCLREIFKAQNRLTVKAPIYNARGNHDVNPVSGQMISASEFYSLAMERTRTGLLSGKCYGFHDIENAKIRVIILNTSDIFGADGSPLINGNNTLIQQAQFAWFCNVALDFSDKSDASEWAVITMAHDKLSVVGNGAFETVLTAFANGTSATATGTRTVDGYTESLSQAVNYSTQGGIDYIGHIYGHYHEDRITTFGTSFKEVAIACAVTTAHYYDENTRKDYTRETGTTDELLFDSICINKKTKLVDLKRFGVGADRSFTY